MPRLKKRVSLPPSSLPVRPQVEWQTRSHPRPLEKIGETTLGKSLTVPVLAGQGMAYDELLKHPSWNPRARAIAYAEHTGDERIVADELVTRVLANLFIIRWYEMRKLTLPPKVQGFYDESLAKAKADASESAARLPEQPRARIVPVKLDGAPSIASEIRRLLAKDMDAEKVAAEMRRLHGDRAAKVDKKYVMFYEHQARRKLDKAREAAK